MFLIFLLSLMAHAQPSEICVIGSPLQDTYVQQFHKAQLSDTDSFLKHYREHQLQQTLYKTASHVLKKSPTKNILKKFFPHKEPVDFIAKEHLECSLRRVPRISSNKKLCDDSSSDFSNLKDQEQYTQETPCVTPSMVQYLHWGINEAVRCFKKDLDDFEYQIIFKKINLESSFGFFFQSTNGTGVAQVIPGTIQDMLKEGYPGHRFLSRHLERNKTQCSSFLELFHQELLVNPKNQIPQCQFISIGDGIGRSYLSGVGLYVYYRSYHTFSAEKILAYLGFPKSNSSLYKKMRASLTLGMYNRGSQFVWDYIQSDFIKKEFHNLYKKSPKLAESQFYERILETPFGAYISDADSVFKSTIGSQGNCKISDPNKVFAQN